MGATLSKLSEMWDIGPKLEKRLFRWPWLGHAVAFTLLCIRENSVLHEGDKSEVLAVGEFELELDGAVTVFVEEDDLGVIEISPVGGAKEGDDFVFGGLGGEGVDLVLDEKGSLEFAESDEGGVEESFFASEFVTVFFEFEGFVFQESLGEEVAIPGFLADGGCSDDEG